MGRPPHTFERRFGYKLGKEGVLEAEKGFSNGYQFKSCIIGGKAGLLTTGRSPHFSQTLSYKRSI